MKPGDEIEVLDCGKWKLGRLKTARRSGDVVGYEVSIYSEGRGWFAADEVRHPGNTAQGWLPETDLRARLATAETERDRLQTRVDYLEERLETLKVVADAGGPATETGDA